MIELQECPSINFSSQLGDIFIRETPEFFIQICVARKFIKCRPSFDNREQCVTKHNYSRTIISSNCDKNLESFEMKKKRTQKSGRGGNENSNRSGTNCNCHCAAVNEFFVSPNRHLQIWMLKIKKEISFRRTRILFLFEIADC